MTKTAAVVGVTGAQGSAVAKALLKSGWKVRGLTRDPNSAKSKIIKDLGVELVAADISKAEDLEKAFAGVDAVFAVTNFYEAGEEGEKAQGKLMADIAKKQKVGHFIYSSLENSNKISGGKNKVPHFTAKAEVDEYVETIGIPATPVQIACYYENFTTYFAPKKNADGVYEFTLPVPADSKIALGSVADLGPVVAKVLDNKDQYAGKKIAVAGDYLTPDEIAATFAKVWGVKVRANIVPFETFAAFGFPFAAEFADMFSWFHSFGYYAEKVTNRDIWEGKKVYPEVLTFEQFLRASFPAPNN